jgi:hypothetical protein
MKYWPWIRRVVFPLLGGVGGFAYFWFIGCQNGSCPITSNPYISTGYGALIGVVLSLGRAFPTAPERPDMICHDKNTHDGRQSRG